MKKLFIIFLLNIFYINESFALIEVDITRGNLDPLLIAVSPLHVDVKSENFNDVKVKKITVNPKQILSYQYHHKRQEQWVIVSDNLTIMLDGKKVFKVPGELIFIPLGSKHRAWNET